MICTLGGHTNKTGTAFIKYLTELVSGDINEEHCKIGGEGITVEIDESKFAKRKNNRGHHVEGAWIVGGVERTEQRRLFARVVENRSAETLHEIIGAHVHPGSIVLTDCWRGYAGMEDELDVTHETVNHSLHFRDPNTGVHTNTIEGTWFAMKRRIPPRNRSRDTVERHVLAFIWRRQHESHLWEAFLNALADTDFS
jgi:transposase-like protein